MNYRLVSRLLGVIALLIGASMMVSLPWASPALGHHSEAVAQPDVDAERQGFLALVASILVCGAVGGILMRYGRGVKAQLFRKEAMAVVGLSWVLATVLGALPFYFAGVYRGPSVRLVGQNQAPLVYHFRGVVWRHWLTEKLLPADQYRLVKVLLSGGARGYERDELRLALQQEQLRALLARSFEAAGGVDATAAEITEEINRALKSAPLEEGVLQAAVEAILSSRSEQDEEPQIVARLVDAVIELGGGRMSDEQFAANLKRLEALAADNDAWDAVLLFPDAEGRGRANNYRLRWVKMGIADSLFESQSGFSTTGATVISDLEDPSLVPHCILFWRSSTHFLGGLGIIVLFVVILGQGSAGKALMRAEMPGPTKEGATARMQHTAWLFAGIYVALNIVLTAGYMLLGLSLFDALCHAFGTMATGGFSTYNRSIGHFDSAWIDYLTIVFMVLAGTNFTLLYYFLIARQPGALFGDIEWRVYMAVIGGVSLLVIFAGLLHGEFDGLADAVRFGLFQVVSIMTTTGYGTHDFDQWNSFGRGVLFLLMFVGGCAGSTGGGMKVIRHILFLKILRLEIERAFHPSVVRPLRLGGKAVEDPDLQRNILLYFGFILVLFVFSWMFTVSVEPDATWGAAAAQHKLIDSASGVAATLNNIGPGLGTVGATQNYGHFSPLSKFLFIWLMMIGRLEIFSIIVLFSPGFWRDR